MTELVVSVIELVDRPDWEQIRLASTITVEVGARKVMIQLVRQQNACGALLRLQCPECRARRRDLWLKDGRLGCRVCLRIRTGVSGTRWNREVLRPARIVQRIENRLQQPMPWNARRRLVRRRARLLRQVQMTLAARRDRRLSKAGFAPAG